MLIPKHELGTCWVSSEEAVSLAMESGFMGRRDTERVAHTPEAASGANADDTLETLWQLCNDVVTSAVVIDRLAQSIAGDHHPTPDDVGVRMDRIIAESIRISEICSFSLQSLSEVGSSSRSVDSDGGTDGEIGGPWTQQSPRHSDCPMRPTKGLGCP